MLARTSKFVIVTVVLVGALFAPARATISAYFEERFLPPGTTLDYEFIPTATGEIRVRVFLQPSQAGALTRVVRKGDNKLIAERTGSLPYELTATVAEADVGQTLVLLVTNTSQQTLEGRIELIFPQRYCQEVNAQYRVKIGYEAGTEIGEIHCLQLYSVLRSLPSDHFRRLREIRAVAPSASVYGYCFPPCTTIFLPGLRAGRTFVIVTYHEIGHTVHFTRASSEQRERWERLFNESGRDPDHFALEPINRTLYAMTNQYEDFAVTYEAYTFNTELYFREALTRSQRGKPLLLRKLQLIMELFQHAVENRPRVYIYRMGTQAPTPKIERASVPITSEGIPEFGAVAQWECFALCD